MTDKPKPRNRKSAPVEESPEVKAQREEFTKIVKYGRMDDEFYARDPTDTEKGLVRSMVFSGIAQETIAACLDIALHRLQYVFRKELDYGREMMVAHIGYSLAARAVAGSDAAAIYLLKVRGGPAFSEARATREADGSPDGLTEPQAIEKSEKDKLIGRIMELVKKAETPEQAKTENKN